MLVTCHYSNKNNQESNNKQFDHVYLIWLKTLFGFAPILKKNDRKKICITLICTQIISFKIQIKFLLSWKILKGILSDNKLFACQMFIVAKLNLVPIVHCLWIMSGWSKLGSNARCQEGKVQQFWQVKLLNITNLQISNQCIYFKFRTRWRCFFKRG